jgi:hypothetical protein
MRKLRQGNCGRGVTRDVPGSHVRKEEKDVHHPSSEAALLAVEEGRGQLHVFPALC